MLRKVVRSDGKSQPGQGRIYIPFQGDNPHKELIHIPFYFDTLCKDMSDSQNLVNWSVQAILAIGLLVAVYYISTLATMHDDLVRATDTAKVKGAVVMGVVVKNTVITTDARLKNTGRTMVPLPASKHQNGGVQFSYSFWIKIPKMTAGTDPTFKRVVLLRGDPTTVPFVNIKDQSTYSLPVAFCPMVIVARSQRRVNGRKVPGKYDVVFSCHINTYNDRNVSVSHKILDGESPINVTEYNLVTVTVQDAYGYGASIESSVACSVWLNQVESRMTASVSKAGVRLNSGNLYLLPTGNFGAINNNSDIDIAMKEVLYANYALSADEIYEKIRLEANQTAVPYKLQANSSNTHAYWDLSMNNLSV